MISSYLLLLQTERLGTRFARLALTAFVCVHCCGCIIPIHNAKKTRVPSGLETKSTVDPSFIKVGQTSREEVVEKLGWADTGVKDDRFFICRWSESSWAALWFLGGPGAGEAGWYRPWNDHNLLIEFDEKGVVQRSTYFPDKDFLVTLSSLVAKYPAHTLDLSAPIEVQVLYMGYRPYFGKLVLGPQSVSFVEDPGFHAKGKHDFQTTPENLRDVVMISGEEPSKKREEQVIEVIHFKRHTKVGDKMEIRTNFPTTMILLKYIAQIGSASPQTSQTPD